MVISSDQSYGHLNNKNIIGYIGLVGLRRVNESRMLKANDYLKKEKLINHIKSP